MADLKTLVPLYYDNKQNLDFYKKECDAQNAEIKKLMAEKKVKDFESEGIVAKYIVQNKESMNEAKLIALLKEKGLVKKEYDGVKILGNGKLTKNLTVVANKFSKTAQKAIEDAGGKIEVA